MVDVTCPTCGREDFASEGGMKRHHALSHDESLPRGREYECGHCGSAVRRQPSAVENSESGLVFCDPECQYGWMSESRFLGSSNPQWSGGGVQKECPVCGSSFTVPRSKNGVLVTCGTECKSVRMGESWEEINPTFSLFVGLAGEDNPAWGGGYEGFSYGAGWDEARRLVRDRDGEECRGCGSDGPILDTHHIVPFSEFDDPLEANRPSNLITLCRSCHMEIDGRVSA